MIDYRQLQAFATVIEEQSFDKAARRLYLTQSAVSQRVKQLEESVGQLLIIRSQPLHATAAGQKLLRHYRQINLLQNELIASLGEAKAKGFSKLAIGLNADTLATWFLDALEPLLRENNVLLELRVDDQDQTHNFLRQGEVIGCISASDQPMQGGRCTPLGFTHYRALASADYMQQYFSAGIDKEALLRAPAVEFNQKDELQDRYLQTFFSFDDNDDYPCHRVPSTESFMDLIARGYAWGMVPDEQSKRLRDTGKLQEVAPGKVIKVPLYWHSWNLTTDISQQLTDCLVNYCRQHLEVIPDINI
ncbi:LysR family transcriptional regulator ArgP [Amphritea sp. HPY]|uniref:LysR family transcriptional regulator ArgP n=1 Tax=Amphritea sp. HPY TaxID=3421652 RepID=UPI003D7E36A7